MNKINKVETIYSIITSLGVLAILAFGITIMPAISNAQNSPYGSYGSPTTNGYVPPRSQPTFNFSPIQTIVQAPIYYNPMPVVVNPVPVQAPVVTTEPAPTVYSNSANQTASTPNIVYTTAPKPPSTVAASKPVPVPVDEPIDLEASAIKSNGFMPTSLVGWIFFAILVLLLAILVRKIFGNNKASNSTPMKHA